jgi:hypothetical protein
MAKIMNTKEIAVQSQYPPQQGEISVFHYILVCILLSILAGRGNAQILFGTNLILNGNAEEGTASTGGNPPDGIVVVPHWVTSGNFTVNQYDQKGATHTVPLDASPSPARGSNFFAGGPVGNDSFAVQEVDVSAAAAEIDSGIVQYFLAGYFGGFHHQNDNAALSATFLTSADGVVGTGSVGRVLSADRSSDNSGTGLLLRKTQGVLPVGTRKVRFLLYMAVDPDLQPNAYNDGYADDLSFVLITPHDPGSGLSIMNTNGNFLIRWPGSLTGFDLQTTSQLQPPIVWSAVTNSIGVENGWFVLTNTPTGPSQYFRLVFQ